MSEAFAPAEPQCGNAYGFNSAPPIGKVCGQPQDWIQTECTTVPDEEPRLTFRACGSGGLICFRARQQAPEVGCCVRQNDWTYVCAPQLCGQTPPPPSYDTGPGRVAPRYTGGPPGVELAPGGRSFDGLGERLGNPATAPDNGDPSPECNLPYDDPGFGVPHPTAGNQAGPDFDCLETPVNGVVATTCTLNPELQTTIASGTKVFAADVVAAARAFVADPTGAPAPGKAPGSVLVNPPGCGGVAADDEEITARGVDLAQGSLAQVFGCKTVGAGPMPIEVGLRYESGSWSKQQGIECQVGPSGTFDEIGYRTANLSNGWTVSYSRRVTRVDAQERYRLHLENQRVYDFVPTAPGATVFVQVGIDGQPLTTLDAAHLERVGGNLVLVYADGTRDFFRESTGAFFESQDRWGNKIWISYRIEALNGVSYLIKRVSQIVPNAGGEREAAYVEFANEWQWAPWQGASRVAERLYRLVAIGSFHGEGAVDVSMALEYDGRYRVTRVTEPLGGGGERAWSFSYDDTSTLSTLTDRRGAAFTTTYRAAPEPADLNTGVRRDGTYSSFSWGYRLVTGQSVNRMPLDGIDAVSLDWTLVGESTLRVGFGTTGLTQLFRHRARSLPAALAAWGANHLDDAVGATRAGLQLERIWRPGVPEAGPYELTERASDGTGVVVRTCRDGRSEQTCTFFEHTTLAPLSGGPATGGVLPKRECLGAAATATGSNCIEHEYESPAARSCKRADLVRNRRLVIDGQPHVVARTTYDATTCAPTAVEQPAHDGSGNLRTDMTWVRTGPATGQVQSMVYTPATRAPVTFTYDERGRVKVRNEGGFTEEVLSTARGNIASTTDRRGRKSTRNLGERLDGQPVNIVTGAGSDRVAEELAYDELGGLVLRRVRHSDGKELVERNEEPVLASLAGTWVHRRQVSEDASNPASRRVLERTTAEVTAERTTTSSSLNDRPARQEVVRNPDFSTTIKSYVVGFPNDAHAVDVDGAGQTIAQRMLDSGARQLSYTFMRPLLASTTYGGDPNAIRTGVFAYFGHSNLPRQLATPSGCVEVEGLTPGGQPAVVLHRTACPDGRIVKRVTTTYDGWGRPVQVVTRDEASGATTTATTTWDALGRVLQSCSDATGINLCTRYEYGTSWDVRATISPGGDRTGYAYDSAGRLASVQSPIGLVAQYSFRGDGRLLDQDLDGQRTRYEWDAFGDKIAETFAAGLSDAPVRRTWARNRDGSVEREVSFDGGVIERAYEPSTGRLASITHPPTTCGVPGGPAVPVASRGAACAAGDVLRPSAGVTTFQYRPSGLVAAVSHQVRDVCMGNDDCDNGGACEIGAGGRIGLCPVRTTVTRYTHDELQQMASRTSEAGALSWTRSFVGGRLATVRLGIAAGDVPNEITYTFDSLGRVSQMEAFGTRRVYGYDERFGTLANATGGALRTAIARDGAGRLTSMTFRRASDRALVFQAAVPVAGGRDRDGNPLVVNERWRSERPATSQFGFDEASRLVSEALPALPPAAQDLSPDVGWGGSGAPASASENTYDRRGNATAIAGRTFNHGIDDQIELPGYSYDGTGNLVLAPGCELNRGRMVAMICGVGSEPGRRSRSAIDASLASYWATRAGRGTGTVVIDLGQASHLTAVDLMPNLGTQRARHDIAVSTCEAPACATSSNAAEWGNRIVTRANPVSNERLRMSFGQRVRARWVKVEVTRPDGESPRLHDVRFFDELGRLNANGFCALGTCNGPSCGTAVGTTGGECRIDYPRPAAVAPQALASVALAVEVGPDDGPDGAAHEPPTEVVDDDWTTQSVPAGTEDDADEANDGVPPAPPDFEPERAEPHGDPGVGFDDASPPSGSGGCHSSGVGAGGAFAFLLVRRRRRRPTRAALERLLIALIVLGGFSRGASADAFLYDSSDRLVRAVRGDVVETLAYDGEGQLQRSCVRRRGEPARCKALLVDPSTRYPRVVAEVRPGGLVAYAHGPSGLELVRLGASVPRSAVQDLQGSHVGEIDSTGSIIGRRAFSPGGRPRAQVGSFVASHGFAGELGGATELVYLRARHYAPALGRFLQRDTFAGLPSSTESLNRYSYAHNNPLVNQDPSGHFVLDLATQIGLRELRRMSQRPGFYDSAPMLALERLAQTAVRGIDVVTSTATFGQLGTRRLRRWLGTEVQGLDTASDLAPAAPARSAAAAAAPLVLGSMDPSRLRSLREQIDFINRVAERTARRGQSYRELRNGALRDWVFDQRRVWARQPRSTKEGIVRDIHRFIREGLRIRNPWLGYDEDLPDYSPSKPDGDPPIDGSAAQVRALTQGTSGSSAAKPGGGKPAAPPPPPRPAPPPITNLPDLDPLEEGDSDGLVEPIELDEGQRGGDE